MIVVTQAVGLHTIYPDSTPLDHLQATYPGCPIEWSPEEALVHNTETGRKEPRPLTSAELFTYYAELRKFAILKEWPITRQLEAQVEAAAGNSTKLDELVTFKELVTSIYPKGGV